MTSFFNWLKEQLDIFKEFESNDTFTGALLPTTKELAEIPKFDEMVATANPVVWKILDINKVPRYPIYSQDGSYSCVANSVALIGTILYYLRTQQTVKFSPAWIYQQRSNRPEGGMIGLDAFKIASTGLLPNDLMNSMDMGETAINSIPIYPWYKDVAKVFSFKETLIQLPTADINTVASVIQTTGKPVNVWFTFNNNEWTSEPQILTNNPPYRHSVVAIDYGIWKGRNCLVIQDSWGQYSTQYGGLRIISEDFFKKRNIFGAYPISFKFDGMLDKPIYDGSIISFQKCMRYLSLFPSNISYVENFGNITKKACLDYQKSQGIPQTGIIDETTKQLLKNNFN